jgi:hypothetical protein
MMTPKRRRAIGPVLLATIGVAVMLTGIGLHWWAEARGQAHTLEWIPQFIGATIAFAGFYRMDPKGAKDGGAFILDAGTRIVGMIQPGGRRSTDAPIVTQPVAVPVDELELPPPASAPVSAPEQPHDVAPLAAIPAKERGDL